MKHLIKKGTSKGIILCIHGNSSSPRIFENLLNSKKISYTVIAIELSGHSKDSKGSIHEFSTKNYCQELIKFINSLNDDVFILGNSFGGHLAIEISDQLKNLKGLMIFGTPPIKKPINFEEAFNVVPALQTFLTEKPTDNEIENAAKVAVFDDRFAQTIIKDFKNVNPLVRSALAIDLANNNWSNQRQMFLELDVPKYIVRGQEDPTVNTKYLQKLVAKDEKCILIDIDKCGHYPTLEQPEKFINILQGAAKKVFGV